MSQQEKNQDRIDQIEEEKKESSTPMVDELRKVYPYGHPAFLDLTLEELKLHSLKNHDYACGGDPLGNFKRVSTIKRLYPKMDWSSPEGVAITYLLKQLDAALWMMASGNEAMVEGPEKRWQDISIYSKIISIRIQESQTE